MKTLIVATILTLCSVQDIDPFVQKMQDYTNEVSSKERPKGKEVYFFDYTTKFEYWDEYMPTQEVRSTVYIGNDKMHYFSEPIDVFVDEDFTATVLKNQNQIVIASTPKDYDPYLSMSRANDARNKVFEKSKLLSVKDTESGLKKIVLDPKTAEIEGLKMNKIAYYCDAKSGEIKKTVTEYLNSYQLKKMIYIQHTTDFDHRYKDFKSVKKMLFKSNGELLDKYKNYEIIVD